MIRFGSVRLVRCIQTLNRKPNRIFLVLKIQNRNRTEPKPNQKFGNGSVCFGRFVRFVGFLHTPKIPHLPLCHLPRHPINFFKHNTHPTQTKPINHQNQNNLISLHHLPLHSINFLFVREKKKKKKKMTQ